MGEQAGPTGVIAGDMAIAAQQVAVGDQTLQAHRSAGGQGLGADSHLGAEAVAVAIGEAGGAIPVNAGAVDRFQEAFGHAVVVGADGVGVAGAVAGDMGEGGVQVGDHPDAEDQVGILGAPIRFAGRQGHPKGAGGLVTPQFDPGRGEHGDGCRHKAGGDALVHQQGLDGIAGRWILGFAVQRQAQGLLAIGGRIHIQMADAVGVAQHRNAGVVLDVAHQGIGAARNDQVHQAVQLQHGQALLAAGQHLQAGRGNSTGRQAFLDGGQDRLGAAGRLPASLEQGAIAGADRQGGDLDHRIRPGLKNHPHHPQGHRDSLQHQSRSQFAMHLAPTDRIGQGRHLAHPRDGAGQFGPIQFQPGQQGWRQALGGGPFQVGPVGGQNGFAVALQCVGHGHQGLLPFAVGLAAQVHGGAPNGRGPCQQLRAWIGR